MSTRSPFARYRALCAVGLLILVFAPRPATSAASPAAVPLDVSFINIAWASPPPPNTAVQQRLEAAANVRLHPIWVPFSTEDQRVNVAINTNSLPDFVQLIPGNAGQEYTSLQIKAIQEGQFTDLTPYITAPNFKQVYPSLGKIPQAVWQQETFNGHIYGVPNNIIPPSNGAIWVRKDLFTKAGLAAPTTIDQLTNVIFKLNQPPQVYGFDLRADFDNTQMKPIANAFTGVQDWAVAKDGSFTYQSFMPQYIAFLQWAKKLYDMRAVNPDFALQQNAGDYPNGKVAVTVFNWWAFTPEKNVPVGNFTAAAPKTADSMEIPPVKGPGGWSVADNALFWTQHAISSRVPKANIPRLLHLLDVLSSDDVLNNLAQNGVKGVDYTVAHGKIVPTKKYQADNPGAWNWFSLGAGGSTVDYWVQKAKLDGASAPNQQMMRTVSATTLRRFDQSPTIRMRAFNLNAPTYAAKWNAIDQQLIAMRVKFVAGQITLADWKQYVQGVTSSADYRQIQKELKAAYQAEKR